MIDRYEVTVTGGAASYPGSAVVTVHGSPVVPVHTVPAIGTTRA
jgi:hypothetical protein